MQDRDRERERMENIAEGNETGDKESVRQKATERRTHRGGRVRNRGKRECVGLEGPQSRKRPLLHGSTLMGLARPRFVHTVGQPLRIKITK